MTCLRCLPLFVATATAVVAPGGCRMENPAFVDSAGGTASGTSGSAGATGGGTTSTSTSGTSAGSASATGTSTTGTFCGDGVRQPDEDCDGMDLGGVTCEGQGFSGGTVTCREDCTFDFGGCTGSGCGDNVVDANEQCDGTNLGGASCGDVGHQMGTPHCNVDCTLSYDDCHTCGNQKIEGPEVCDGDDVQGMTCDDLANQGYHGSDPLTCSGDCLALVPEGCAKCGNGVIEKGEECDANAVDATCNELGNFDNGTVACTNECTYDTSLCTKCGDGMVEGDEACEPGVEFFDTCKTLGFDDAKPNDGLACSPECTFDTSGCCNNLGSPCDNDGQCCGILVCTDTGNDTLCMPDSCKGPGEPCQGNFECCSMMCDGNNGCM